MSALSVGLVLIAAVVHAGWNRFLHDVEDRPATMAVAGLTGFVLLSPAIIASPPSGVPILITLSALAETAYVLCLVAAYSRGALSVAYPVARGTAPLLVTFGGWLFLAQPPTTATIAGASLLGAGLLALGLGREGRATLGAIGFALATGCCIAAYSLIDARAVASVSPAGYLGVVLGFEGLLLVAGLRGDWDRLRSVWRQGVLVGVGTVAAYLLVLLALQHAHAGPVATLREVSILIAILIARDRAGRSVWAGGAMVVAGAILAAL